MRNVTIIHVAEAAGVSMKSVSRVINGEPHVSAKVREKVERAMAELHFVPNMAARSLAGARSFAIAVLFDNPSPAYVMKVLEGAHTACRRSDHQLVLENIDTRGDVDAAMRSMLKRRLDGMIVTPPASDCVTVLDYLEERDIAYVRMGPLSFPDRSLAVGVDDRQAAADLAEYLWSLGHRHFGLVNGPAYIGVSAVRRAGCIEKLESLGAVSIQEQNGAFTFQSGMEAGLSLLRADNRPTAIIAANDDMAAGIYAAAGVLGLRIPQDLSVTGFDDGWIAQSVWPALTTVYQPIAEMADRAAEMLISRGRKDADEGLFPYRLVKRNSVARLNA